MKQTGGHFLSMLAHLSAGVTLAGAGKDLKGIARILGQADSPANHAISPVNHPLTVFGFQEETIGTVRTAMLMLLGAVAFFLLIACVNVANLLLARSDSRRREIGVRKAIGAGGAQLFRQFAVEGLMLSGAGALLGVGLAWVGVRLPIVATNEGASPQIREAALDLRVLIFAVAVAVVTGLVFCMAPMIQSLRQPVNEVLKASGGRMAGSRQSHRVRALLVMSEISLSLVLLIGSGLLVRAFWKLQAVDAGIRADHLLTARLSLTSAAFNDRDRLRQFWIRANDSLNKIPGVVSATLVAGLPPERRENDNTTMIEGYRQDATGLGQIVAFYQQVGDGFFETVGARLIEGRFFDRRDDLGTAPVVIVNQAMARTFWPGQSAVGRRLRVGGQKDFSTVIGVVGDIRNGGMSKPAATELFLSARQGRVSQDSYVIVRTSGNPELAANAVRAALAEVDSTVPVSHLRTMEDVMASTESQPRFLALILTVFSSLALVLAGFGIYGVVAYSVAQRTSEFGVRMALGAGRGDIPAQVLREGAFLGIVGAVAGCLGAAGVTRVLEGFLFEVSRFDFVTFATMAAILIVVSLFASWLPAKRATSVSPVTALRYE